MISRFLARLLFSLVGRLHVTGADRTSRTGAYVLAANHISHFDPPILAAAAKRKVDWMAMIELFENPLVSAWLRGIDSFPVNRAQVDRTAVRTALRRLKLGRVAGMFPEGGIRDGANSVLEGAPMRAGIGAIVQLANTPVIPCVILGSDRFYAWKSWLPLKQVNIWIAFGEPITCEGTGKLARAKLEARLGEALRLLYAEMRARYGLCSSDLPQPPSRRKGRC